MDLYNKHILPKLINRVCAQNEISRIRKELIPRAKGKVLEIGMGSGLNLPFYDPVKTEQVSGVEPVDQLRRMAAKKARSLTFKVDFTGRSAEAIPLANNVIDTVVVTYTMCSIPDVIQALKEMNRVLKPGGELLFCEHGRSPDQQVSKWQDKLTRPWQKVAGGCHLNRPVADLITQAGFKIVALDSGYTHPIKLLSYTYKGVAVV